MGIGFHRIVVWSLALTLGFPGLTARFAEMVCPEQGASIAPVASERAHKEAVAEVDSDDQNRPEGADGDDSGQMGAPPIPARHVERGHGGLDGQVQLSRPFDRGALHGSRQAPHGVRRPGHLRPTEIHALPLALVAPRIQAHAPPSTHFMFS